MPILNWLRQPWPWWIAGPLIGLTVPALLLLGNRNFGVSSSLRHICAAFIPARIPFFRYDWKKEIWNLFFVGGILLGSLIVLAALKNPEPVHMNPLLRQQLQGLGVRDFSGLMPTDLFSWPALFTPRSLVLIVAGGFLVGFGIRYAGGCTSGHSIMGLSTLQWPSLVATCCFMAGGFIAANFLLPYILRW
jgi:uncharacterized membrane protein YedE/YeeE